MALSRPSSVSAILTLSLALTLSACGGGSGNGILGALGQGQQTSFASTDLDGLWVGTTQPLEANVDALELTLGFLSFGPTANAVGLTEYSFPGINEPGTVDYLSLLDSYDLLFGPNGHLSLDTVLIQFQPSGMVLEERTGIDLWMSKDGTHLVGTEIIETDLNGTPDLRISNLLTMDRL